MLALVLILFAVLTVVASVPIWPHSRRWGYGPATAAVILLVTLLALLSSTNLLSGLP